MSGCSRRRLLGGMAAWSLYSVLPARADDNRFAAPQIRYQPVLRGAPLSRVASGSRGAGMQAQLNALAPEQGGLSAQAQPRLYWYVDQPLGRFMEIALFEAAPRMIDPLLRRELPVPAQGGIHVLDLNAYGIRLVPGTEYEWLVALVPDPLRRSYDLIASATVHYEPPPVSLSQRLAQAPLSEQARLYAEHGYWYDALHTLGEQIKQQPDNPIPYRLRAELLRQVGLTDAAAYAQAQAG